MPRPIRLYVKYVDALNYRVGRLAMYLVFVMIGVLLYSSISKTFLLPSVWTLETAQFLMVAYFLLGGAYSLQLDAHVRMDLLYGTWPEHRRLLVDTITVFCMIIFLGLLLYGGISSTVYALEYGERSYSAWRPYMAPIKIIMCIGIFLTLLQAISVWFKDIAMLRGEEL